MLFGRISVGAIKATSKPLSSAIKAVQAATSVLPEPTSPCSNRRMGCSPDMSFLNSRSTLACASVSLNPSRARKGRMR